MFMLGPDEEKGGERISLVWLTRCRCRCRRQIVVITILCCMQTMQPFAALRVETVHGARAGPSSGWSVSIV